MILGTPWAKAGCLGPTLGSEGLLEGCWGGGELVGTPGYEYGEAGLAEAMFAVGGVGVGRRGGTCGGDAVNVASELPPKLAER